MKQQFKFLKIQQLFTILMRHCLFAVRLHRCMSKFVQVAFFSQKKSCWRLAVTNSLSSAPFLKDIDMIFGCVWENVSKPAVGSAEVDRNDYISFSLRRHVIQDSLRNVSDTRASSVLKKFLIFGTRTDLYTVIHAPFFTYVSVLSLCCWELPE